MSFKEVGSSNIAAVRHDGALHTLEVRFKSGDVYQYFGVTPEQYSDLMAAKSIGSHFAANIKGKHEFKKI